MNLFLLNNVDFELLFVLLLILPEPTAARAHAMLYDFMPMIRGYSVYPNALPP